MSSDLYRHQIVRSLLLWSCVTQYEGFVQKRKIFFICTSDIILPYFVCTFFSDIMLYKRPPEINHNQIVSNYGQETDGYTSVYVNVSVWIFLEYCMLLASVSTFNIFFLFLVAYTSFAVQKNHKMQIISFLTNHENSF